MALAHWAFSGCPAQTSQALQTEHLDTYPAPESLIGWNTCNSVHWHFSHFICSALPSTHSSVQDLQGRKTAQELIQSTWVCRVCRIVRGTN